MSLWRRQFSAGEPSVGWRFISAKVHLTSKVNAMQYVYVMKSTSGLVKIGVSKNVLSRLKTLEASSGLGITLVKTFGPLRRAIGLERASHALLSSKREYGEWFSVNAEEAISVISSIGEEYADLPSEKFKEVTGGSSISAAERHLACFDSEEEIMKTVQLLRASGMEDKASLLLKIKNSMSLSTRDCMHMCQMEIMQKRIDDMAALMQGAAK